MMVLTDVWKSNILCAKPIQELFTEKGDLSTRKQPDQRTKNNQGNQ